MSAKLRNTSADDGEDCKMDMSPMIDMVFLLLIFFMVASTMITIKLDPDVNVPDAFKSSVDSQFKGRVLVNIHKDGKMYGVDGISGGEISELEIQEMCERTKELYPPASGVPVRLFIRADKEAPVRSIKKATKAAGAGGVAVVMFTSYLKLDK